MNLRHSLLRSALCVVVWAVSIRSVTAQAVGGAEGTWIAARRTLPGGVAGSSVVDLEQILPREIRQGQPFDYQLRVANFADCPLSEVAVVQRLPASVSILGSYPQADVRDGMATWRLGTLALKESRVIQVRATTTDTGPMTFCCDTQYRAPLCATVTSTRPDLLLTMDVAAQATPCDTVPVRVAVRNTGTGQCTDVRVRITLPEDMAGPDGGREYAFQVPVLPAGQVRRTEIMARPASTGTFRYQASAVSAEGIRSDAMAETRVVAAKLTVKQTGTDTQLAGRAVAYSFSVRNEGDGTATNLVIEDVIPAGVQVMSLKPTEGQTTTGSMATWRLPELPPGAAMEFSVTVKADLAGVYPNQVTARADCAEDAMSSHAAQVKGIPAILLEVVDQDDPIEIGGMETYVIAATNQGSAVGTNLTVKCQIEDNYEYLSSDGPSKATVNGGQIVFAPLPQLAPKAKAVWLVTCRALKEGDVRFKVELTSDQLTRPVDETESTRLY